MITSPHNEKLKEIRRLARRRGRERSGTFVAEGEDLLAAADAAGWPAVERYVAAGSGLEGVEVEAELLTKVSALGSGTRALAVYEERWAAPTGPLCVYLHGVGDPGNVGAVLRSALAFGAACVALGPGCADPFGPRAVRASMGAIFSVPVARADSPGDLVAALTPFASRGINLSKIESRPTRGGLGKYFFLIDIEGHQDDAGVAAALQGVRANSYILKVLGSYPASSD